MKLESIEEEEYGLWKSRERNEYKIRTYPSVDAKGEVCGNVLKCTAKTILRKKHRGKYYEWIIIERSELGNLQLDDNGNIYPEVEKEELLKIVHRIHMQTYKAVICGKINLRIKMPDGIGLFKLDPSQVSEEYRLKRM